MLQSPVPHGLPGLALEISRDLTRLNYPPPDWVLPATGPDGKPRLDVLVVGGGMCGQTAAFALIKNGIRNVRVIDRAARGQEGPWANFARMPTLRSPKQLTGPDLGIPSLTFRAWFEARYGRDAWDALYKIARLDWRDYLLWVRDTLALPIENQVELTTLEPHGDWVQATLRSANGIETIQARKVVLALGRDGSGAPRWPTFSTWRPDRPRARVHHAAEGIDFEQLRGARVAVLGAGATAFDNAGTALEAGARELTLFARRPILPQVNKSKWASFPGFQRGFVALDDATRWGIFTYIFAEQVPPPFESVERCDRHPGFSLLFDEPWLDLVESSDGVVVKTPVTERHFDAVIVATGFDVDLTDRPELASFRDRISTWRDRVSAAQAGAHPEVARFPYLDAGFGLIERAPDSTTARAGLSNIHVFNWGSTLSHGQLAGDIPGLETGALRLADAITQALFVRDADRYVEALHRFAEPELASTRYFISRSSPRTP